MTDIVKFIQHSVVLHLLQVRINITPNLIFVNTRTLTKISEKVVFIIPPLQNEGKGDDIGFT